MTTLDEIDHNDAAAIRRVIVSIATFTLCELALHRLERARRRRERNGEPPLVGRAGKTGYTDGHRDGYREGLAAAAPDKATGPAS